MRIEPGFDLDVTRDERVTVMADMTTLALQQAKGSNRSSNPTRFARAWATLEGWTFKSHQIRARRHKDLVNAGRLEAPRISSITFVYAIFMRAVGNLPTS